MKITSSPRQGEIYWVDFDPTRGFEQAGKRPAVVISGNSVNELLTTHIVFPLTSQLRGTGGRVAIGKDKSNGLKTDSDVLVMQIRTADIARFGKKIGHISGPQVRNVIASLGVLLTY